MTLEERRREIVTNNYDVIRQCIDTTLDELYDFKEALEIEGDTHNAEVLITLINNYEILKKSYAEKSLSEFQLEQIAAILEMRAKILEKKAADLDKAAKQLSSLRDEFIGGTPKITVLKN